MWTIEGCDPAPATADHQKFLYRLTDQGRRHIVVVNLGGSVLASDPEGLPSQVAQAVRTNGRSVVEKHLGDTDPPSMIDVGSDTINVT